MYLFRSLSLLLSAALQVEEIATVKCPSFERLVDYLDGRLGDAEARGVASHLAGDCPRCTEDSDWYRRLCLTTSTDQSSAPPPWVLRRAFKIFESHHAVPGLLERLREAVASLVFDSFARPAQAGVRSTDSAARQLLYKSGEFSIDLQVVPSERSRMSLLGQILREGELAFESVGQLELELIQDGATIRSVSSSGIGEFAFADVEPGLFDLAIRFDGRTIVVPDIPVENRS
jgi:hypothetical protein